MSHDHDQRFFVCINQKSGIGEAVAKALKKQLKVQKLKKSAGGERVRVQTCNCLDLCKKCKKGPGAAIILYPEGIVFGNVLPDDVADLVADHLG